MLPDETLGQRIRKACREGGGKRTDCPRLRSPKVSTHGLHSSSVLWFTFRILQIPKKELLWSLWERSLRNPLAAMGPPPPCKNPRPRRILRSPQEFMDVSASTPLRTLWGLGYMSMRSRQRKREALGLKTPGAFDGPTRLQAHRELRSPEISDFCLKAGVYSRTLGRLFVATDLTYYLLVPDP